MARLLYALVLAVAVIALSSLPRSLAVDTACTTQTWIVKASSTCEIFNNADNTGPEFNGGLYSSQDQSAHIFLDAGDVIQITAYHNFTLSDPQNPALNDFWCSALAQDSPPAPGHYPNANQCSWANGMKYDAPVAPRESQPGVPIANWPVMPQGAVALRLGPVATAQYYSPEDAKTYTIYPDAAPYFQAFPVGPTGGAGVNAGSKWQLDWPDWSFLTSTFTVGAGQAGRLYACLWGPNNIAKYGSIHMQIDVTSGTAICGDPQFVGFRGQSFQVHGMDGQVYNLITQPALNINALFVFLTEGQCPVVNGRLQSTCWSHPGTYLGEIGVMANVNGKVYRARLVAGSAAEGIASVTVNGQSLAWNGTKSFVVYDTAATASASTNTVGLSVRLLSSHRVEVTTQSFKFVFDSSDKFFNQRVKLMVPFPQLAAHGLLGQTHREAIYDSPLKHVEGEVDDYAEGDNELFGTDFVYNRYQSPDTAADALPTPSNLVDDDASASEAHYRQLERVDRQLLSPMIR